MNNKLIYILNYYSEEQSSHFYHILNLLEEISLNETDVILIIEKSEGKPRLNSNIRVITQHQKNPLLRLFELYRILVDLNKDGYKKIFIRISQNAALPSIVVSRLYNSEVYYWQSGTTHTVNDKRIKEFKDILFLVKSRIPFFLTKTYVDHFVTGPESMLDYYRDVVKVPEKILMVLYNDIDIERFSKVSGEEINALKNKLLINSNKKIILFVHRLSPVRKSLFYMPYVIESIAETLRENNYKCIVIGGGSEKDSLVNEVNEKKLDDIIDIIGEKPNAIIQQYYQISDLFINPSFTEGFPRVLLEAMASGLPIVTTNAGGIKDILGSSQLKYMVDINDRDGFSKCLKALILNQNDQNTLSSENIKQLQKYSTKNVAKMYIDRIFTNV